jgi:uncharacterized Fe-S cluster protein YjdI
VSKIREYEGPGIVIRYDVLRCIHAAECVDGLRAVFDPDRRPWVDATAASADEIATTVARCPSGALHFARTAGGEDESAPAEGVIRVEANGPLYVRGQLAITDDQGRVVCTDSRVALCRCGASENKPFCDNSHRRVGFEG